MKFKTFYRTFCWPTLFTVLGVSLLSGLGTWQLKRLEWKETLIQRISDQLKQPTKTLDALLAESLGSLESKEYQKVTATGAFLYEGEMKLRGRTHEGTPCFHLITPLILSSGAMVLVDRGWVPELFKETDVQRPEGPQNIKGIIRLKQKHSFFTPQNDFEKNELYVINPGEIAKAKNFTTLLPFYIIAYSIEGEKAYPRPAETGIQVRNCHLQYALMWYMLALGLAITYIVYIRQRLKTSRNRKAG